MPYSWSAFAVRVLAWLHSFAGQTALGLVIGMGAGFAVPALFRIGGVS